MKTYKNLMEKIASEENIRAAIMNASKRKRNRKDVKEVLDDMETHVARLLGKLKKFVAKRARAERRKSSADKLEKSRGDAGRKAERD